MVFKIKLFFETELLIGFKSENDVFQRDIMKYNQIKDSLEEQFRRSTDVEAKNVRKNDRDNVRSDQKKSLWCT